MIRRDGLRQLMKRLQRRCWRMAGRKSSASNIKMPDVNALFGLEEGTGG